METLRSVSDVVNARNLPPGTVIYTAGNAATPQLLLGQLAVDTSIRDIHLYGLLLLGDSLAPLCSEDTCRRITHRVLFNSNLTRPAVNNGWAYYHPMHLSEIPRYMSNRIRPTVVFLSVAGPDKGGNYSLGTTVEGVLSAVQHVTRQGGLVIAECNEQMPFVLGTTIPPEYIDYLVPSSYPLPSSPVHMPDETAMRIGEIIASLFIEDGSGSHPGSTLQYGIGEVPEAVTAAILKRKIGDLAIHTELLAGAMAKLIKQGVVTNRWKKHLNFSVASIFLAEDQEGYRWLNYNSSVQSRPSNYTNSVFKIAEQPGMVAVNSAIGVDLHGNVWADSLEARKIYSGVGGQSDFIRGAQYSDGGVAIIALKSTTSEGISKIVDRAPAGITATATPADQVILVTEFGALDPRGLSLGERAVGIAHLAGPTERERLLRIVRDSPEYHKPHLPPERGVKGFTSFEDAVRSGHVDDSFPIIGRFPHV